MLSETPLLKTTLDAQREEKDGAVFYRLSDPTTGREYRLYEVEYFIAQMLDGQSPLSDISARVHDELKFDLSPNDLERFVRELESLGFLTSTGAAVASGSDDAMSLSAADIIDDADVAEVDKMAVTDELDRLVRSALLHVKQGMVSQARDYFLAAKKYAATDEKVGTMLNHLDVVGEDDGPNDIEYLWKQAVVLYPELTQEIGPPGIGVAPIPLEEQRERKTASSRRFIMIGALVALVVVGFSGWEFFGRALLRPVLEVETDKVRVQRQHLFYDAEATDAGPQESFPHAFEKSGPVVDVIVKTGEQVKKGQVLARQRLSPAEEKQLATLRQKRQTAEKAFLAVTMEVEKATNEIAAKTEESEKTKKSVDELQRLIGVKPPNERAAPKKELAQLKKSQASLKKDLATLKKKTTPAQKNQAKLKKGLDAAKASEDALEQKASWAFLHAVADGYITQIAVEPGAKVEAGASVVTVADTHTLRVRFKGPDRRLQQLLKDGRVKLFSRDAEIVEAKVSDVSAGAVFVEVADNDGAFGRADKKALKLVRETLEQAFVVSAGARIQDGQAYVVEGDEAVRRNVDWAEVRGGEAIARSGLKAGEVLVVGPDKIVPQLAEERVKVKVLKRGVEANP
jgi:HlyD family secretion protein